MFVSLVIIIVSIVPLSIRLADIVHQTDWHRFKPNRTLIDQMMADKSIADEVNVRELAKRIANGQLGEEDEYKLVELALAMQGDRQKEWTPEWNSIVYKLLSNDRFSEAQMQTLWYQGVQSELHVKPILRKDRPARIDMTTHFDRMPPELRIYGKRYAEAITLDETQIYQQGAFQLALAQNPLGLMTRFNGRETIQTRLPTFDDRRAEHASVSTTIIYEITLVEPIKQPPIRLEIPVVEPVRLVDRFAIVDTFIDDPQYESEMIASVPKARLDTADGHTILSIYVDNPPVSIAVSVYGQQGNYKREICTLHVSQGANRWFKSDMLPVSFKAGKVDLILKPSQAAADRWYELGTYWNRPIVLNGIEVNAQHEPPFNYDKSIAADMEAAAYVDQVLVKDGSKTSVEFKVGIKFPPCRATYEIYLRCGDKPHLMRVSNLDVSGPGTGQTSNVSRWLPDPDAETVDIILMPDKRWISRRSNQTPPWGYPLIFENIPLPREVNGDVPAGPFEARAVLDGRELIEE